MAFGDLFRIVPVEDVTEGGENNIDMVESNQSQEPDEVAAQQHEIAEDTHAASTESEVARLEKMIETLTARIDNMVIHAPTVSSPEPDASPASSESGKYVGLRETDWLLNSEEKR